MSYFKQYEIEYVIFNGIVYACKTDSNMVI